MALSSTSHHSFIKGNNLQSPVRKPPRKTCHRLPLLSPKASLEKEKETQSSSNKSEFKLGKLAAVTLAAGALVLGSVDGDMAAKSGGRVGDQAFRSAPRSSGPRINNSSSESASVPVANPPVVPPLVGGLDWSSFSYLLPDPSAAVGVDDSVNIPRILYWCMVWGILGALIRMFFFGNYDDDDLDFNDLFTGVGLLLILYYLRVNKL